MIYTYLLIINEDINGIIYMWGINWTLLFDCFL